MQTRCTVSLVLTLLTIGVVNTQAQVSPTLSNLKATSINESLVPDTSNTIDLGSPNKYWRDTYVFRDLWVGRRIKLPASLTIHAPGLDNIFMTDFFDNQITTGSYNVATGFGVMGKTTTGSNNVAVGNGGLWANTSGYFNCAIGTSPLHQNTTGYENVAMGLTALYANKTGYKNVAIGSGALKGNADGINNVAVGANTLQNNYHGFNNTVIGTNADVALDNLSNATAIGAYASVNASNKVRVGNTTITSIGGHVSWTTFSDGRYKKNIKENVAGLAFINRLRPVSYTVDIQGLDAYYNKARQQSGQAMDEKEKALHEKAIEEATSIIYDGFLAQEVEKAANETNFVFSGVDKPANEQDLYGLRYDQFVVPLVKAVQELSAKNDSLQRQLNELKEMLLTTNDMRSGQDFGNTVSVDAAATQATQVMGASLEQNRPNPFSKATAIPYTLPQKYSTASIIITDYSGKKLRQITITGEGKGFLQIDAATLPANAYSYSLLVDGKLIATRKMLLNR